MQLFCFSVVPSNGSQFELTTDNVYVDSALADERTGLNRQQDQPVCLSGNFLLVFDIDFANVTAAFHQTKGRVIADERMELLGR